VTEDPTILLVDSEPHVADVAFEALDGAGLPVVRVTADSAPALLELESFCCVVVCVPHVVAAGRHLGGGAPHVVLALRGNFDDAEHAVAIGFDDALCGVETSPRLIAHRVRCAAARGRKAARRLREDAQAERVTAVGLVAEAVADALRPVAALLERSLRDPDLGAIRSAADEVGELLAGVEGFVGSSRGPVGEA
jgi:CheY-like chemotaxis protein